MIENPLKIGKALIRPMIKAPKGWSIIVSDYSGIENRLLAWLAEDTETLQDFKNGVDQYITMAAARYNIDYQAIFEGHEREDKYYSGLRQMGKVIVLGCGYQMGKKKFKSTAWDQFKLEVSLEEADLAVKAYRAKYYLVKELWNGLKNAAARTVITGQRNTYKRITFGLAKVNGIIWLAMKLPSGKCIYYMDPKVKHFLIPDYEEMGPVPCVTHLGTDPDTKQFTRLRLTPGRLTENATQGSAREVMGHGMQNVRDHMPEVKQIASVHDEGIGLIRNDDIRPDTLTTFNYHLCNVPRASDAQLSSKAWIGPRYKK
jgi:DNA polymerase bacteriophage-type